MTININQFLIDSSIEKDSIKKRQAEIDSERASVNIKQSQLDARKQEIEHVEVVTLGQFIIDNLPQMEEQIRGAMMFLYGFDSKLYFGTEVDFPQATYRNHNLLSASECFLTIEHPLYIEHVKEVYRYFEFRLFPKLELVTIHGKDAVLWERSMGLCKAP